MQQGKISNITNTFVSNESEFGDFFKDEIIIPFPLQKFIKIRTEGVDNKELDHTIRQILQQQQTSRIQTIISAIILTIIGLFLAYIGLIVWIIAFLNPFILVSGVILLIKYFLWQINAIKMRVLKKQKKHVSLFLEQQNKRFYFRKLIKWKLDNDNNKILLQNLRG